MNILYWQDIIGLYHVNTYKSEIEIVFEKDTKIQREFADNNLDPTINFVARKN